MKFAGRLLGLDLGRKRVGVALSDETAAIASPLATIAIRDKRDLAGQVAGLIKTHGVVAVVVGLPVRLDGSDNDFSAKARSLLDYLRQHLPVPVHPYDERFTSKMAQAAIHDSGKRLKDSKSDIDKIAAAIMLNDFIRHYADR